MTHFHKIYDDVDVAPLLAQIDAHPELWDRHSIRKDRPGTPHREMSDIWIRYNAFERYDPANPAAFNEEHVPVWYPAWHTLPALRPILFDLMATVEGEAIGFCLITRIPAGKGIAPHVDRGWHVDYTEKFYLSLKSAPGAKFVCDHGGARQTLEPKPGEIWLFDNRKLHWVDNSSDQDRMTLIMCIRTAMFGRV